MQVAVLARVVEQVPAAAEKFVVPVPRPLRVITPPELLVIVKDAEGLELPTLVLGKVFEIGEMVTVGAPAEDSNAPISHGPDAGRAIPFLSLQAAGINVQSGFTPSNLKVIRLFPVCHATDELLVSWYGGVLEEFNSGFPNVLFRSCVVGSPCEFPQACHVERTLVPQPGDPPLFVSPMDTWLK